MLAKQSKQQAELPRNSLSWLLIAQFLVIIPHLAHSPAWIVAFWLLCAFWRIQVYRMRAKLPGTAIKLSMMFGSGLAVYFSRGGLTGLDAGVALLLSAFVLKLVELRSKRDALVLIYLGFFVITTSYLFADDILAALYSLLPLLALLAALAGLQQSRLAANPRQLARLVSTLVAQALPLALLLFLFFPRFDPLWSLPMPKDRGVTGLGEQISPGDIAELSQSDELVFRATFKGEIPAPTQLYWRAISMSRFDGRAWHIRRGEDFLTPSWQPQGEALEYSVIMQPSSRPWLYALTVSTAQQEDVRLMGDFRLQRNTPVHRTYFYEAHAWLDAIAEPRLEPRQLRSYLQLPHKGNPQAQQWARQLRLEFSDDEQLVQAVLRHFNQQPFFYSLRPPKLGQDSVDEFLFNTKTGFCEHYSSGMAFVLRAAGIPARVVAGYQGGEINQANNFVQVRQFDAHSWVEYWQPARGWQQVDPTFQVAPDRIELGLQEALAELGQTRDTGVFSPHNYRHVAWLNKLRINLDTINYHWHTKVLGYQAERQSAWLTNLFGSLDWRQIGLVLLSSLALVFSLLALLLFKPWRTRTTASARLLAKFDAFFSKKGYVRQPAEGLRTFEQRLAAGLSSEQRQALASFIAIYEQLEYAKAQVEFVQLNQQFAELKSAF